MLDPHDCAMTLFAIRSKVYMMMIHDSTHAEIFYLNQNESFEKLQSFGDKWNISTFLSKERKLIAMPVN